MTMPVGGVSPVSYTTTSTSQPSSNVSFDQLINQLSSSFGVPPQQLFSMLTSSIPGFSPQSNANSEEMQKALSQFAANTLQSGQGMMKEAMEKFFNKEDEEPDEDDPDSEPL